MGGTVRFIGWYALSHTAFAVKGHAMAEGRNVINSILASYDHLSDSERRIADFILQRRGTVSSLTAGEIAKGSGTSNTTVSRFVRTLGYDSFAQLRLALAREEVAKERPFDSSDGISFDNVEGSVRYVLERKVEELNDTLALLNMDELAQSCRLIQRSKTVMFVGVGTSLSFAQMVATKFSHVGVRAVSPATSDAAAILAQLMGPEDCVVFISNSAKSRRLNIIMDNVQDSAIPSIIITADPTTHLAARADHVLVVSNRDHLLANNFAVSHNSLNFVVECMVLLLFHDSPDAQEYLRMFQKTFSSEKQAGDGGVHPAKRA